MPRRGHKKSRAGCHECKRRHVKCDETRPSCVNCKVASLTCSYVKSAQASSSTPQALIATPAYSPLTPDTTNTSARTQNVSLASPSAPESLNMDHLELLHHFETLTYQSFSLDSDLATTFRETAVSNALRFPFLMYAILAASAVHLCRLRPERSVYYRSLASSLQAAGLRVLDDTLLNITKENCVAVFIFSTTTGLHSFCDTFIHRDQNFNDFLDRFTNCIQLMRGVRSVMGDGWWGYLQTTSLAGLLATGDVLGGPNVDKDKETRPLWELLQVSDLGASSREIYEDTITTLQRVFNAENQLNHPERSVNMVFAWPVLISLEYNGLLVQRRPEALIILAYYGVILHRRREAWAVGDSGKFLIDSICDYLGKHWERWLLWPKSVASSAPGAPITTTPV